MAFESRKIRALDTENSLPLTLYDYLGTRSEPIYRTVLKATPGHYSELNAFEGYTNEALFRLRDAIRILDSFTYLSLSQRMAFFAKFALNTRQGSTDEVTQAAFLTRELGMSTALYGYLDQYRKKDDYEPWTKFLDVMKLRESTREHGMRYLPEEFDLTVYNVLQTDPQLHLTWKQIAQRVKLQLIGKYPEVETVQPSSLIERIQRSRDTLIKVELLPEEYSRNRLEVLTETIEADILDAYRQLALSHQHSVKNIESITGYYGKSVHRYLSKNGLEPLSRVREAAIMTTRLIETAKRIMAEEGIEWNNLSLKELAEAMNAQGFAITDKGVKEYWDSGKLAELGVRRREKYSEEQKFRVIELRQAGLSIRQIVQEIGLAYGVVYNILNPRDGKPTVGQDGQEANFN